MYNNYTVTRQLQYEFCKKLSLKYETHVVVNIFFNQLS